MDVMGPMWTITVMAFDEQHFSMLSMTTLIISLFFIFYGAQGSVHGSLIFYFVLTAALEHKGLVYIESD